MGNFYVNYTLRGSTQREAAAALSGRRAAVSPEQGGAVVVFDEESDFQDSKVVSALTERLSASLECPALAVRNHDDDILYFCLYSNGELVDEYDSNPGYFDFDSGKDLDWEALASGNPEEAMKSLPPPAPPRGGDASALCSAFSSEDTAAVEAILRAEDKQYVFAFERHRALCRALAIPDFAVGNSYASFTEDGVAHGLGRDQMMFAEV